MNSNKWLIGVSLATVALMSGSLALAQEDSNATVVQDTYVIAGDNSDNNYATQDFLRAGAAPGDNWEQIVYVQFDLSPLPDDQHVQNATLKLFNNWVEWENREYTYLGVKAVAEPWEENNVTFNTRPALDDATVYDSVLFQGENSGTERIDTQPDEWVSWDVTDLVQAWSDESLENNGLAVLWQENGEFGSLYPRFSSMQFIDDESLWPQLDVTFGDGPPPIDDLKGDVNADLVVNGLDVDPFVDVLLNGTTDAGMEYRADVNDDGVVNGLDVDPFVALVVGGGVAAVPEPSSFALVLLALASLVGLAIRGGR